MMLCSMLSYQAGCHDINIKGGLFQNVKNAETLNAKARCSFKGGKTENSVTPGQNTER